MVGTKKSQHAQTKTKYKARPIQPVVTLTQCLLTTQPNLGDAQENKIKQWTSKWKHPLTDQFLSYVQKRISF